MPRPAAHQRLLRRKTLGVAGLVVGRSWLLHYGLAFLGRRTAAGKPLSSGDVEWVRRRQEKVGARSGVRSVACARRSGTARGNAIAASAVAMADCRPVRFVLRSVPCRDSPGFPLRLRSVRSLLSSAPCRRRARGAGCLALVRPRQAAYPEPVGDRRPRPERELSLRERTPRRCSAPQLPGRNPDR